MEKHNNQFRDPTKKVQLIDVDEVKDIFCIACSTHKKYKWPIAECRGEGPHANRCFKMRLIEQCHTVDAVEVVHGHWKEYLHSALVRWKDGEPIWADRSVFRCSRCDFGTIARHNYCPRCGADMRERKDNDT